MCIAALRRRAHKHRGAIPPSGERQGRTGHDHAGRAQITKSLKEGIHMPAKKKAAKKVVAKKKVAKKVAKKKGKK